MSHSDETARDYDRLAERYACEIGNELDGKPLDRALLRYIAESARGRGPVGDLGCGPGHVAGYLAALGAETIGVDLAPEMVRVATAAHPGLRFMVGDLRALPLSDRALAGAVAFYSFIHFDSDEEVRCACREVARVLAPGAEVLVAYHRGDEVVHPGELFGMPVNLAFHFLPDEAVSDALVAADLEIRAKIHREPYPGVEHSSRRTYLLAARPE